MKALLIKELKTSILFMIFIAVFSMFSTWAGTMYIGMIYVLMLPILIINQDELTRFNRLASMMPISNATVVLEKYVLVLIGLVESLLFTGLGMLLGYFVMDVDVLGNGLPSTLLVQLIILFLYLTITMPINFAISSQVGRTVCMIVSLMIVGAAVGVWTGLSKANIMNLQTVYPYIALGISIVLCILSIPLTIFIYNRKDK